MIISVYKDIFNSDAAIIAHQVNCRGIMGAGLAKEIAMRYPHVEREYKLLCQPTYPSDSLLGTCQVISIGPNKYIANLFGQDFYETSRRQTRYSALKKAMQTLLEDAKNLEVNTIAFPYMIGCGLAGGNWNTVFHIIYEVYNKSDMDIEICRK